MPEGGNFAIRPLYEIVGDKPVSRGWEIIQVIAEQPDTLYAKRVGTVDTQVMSVSSMTFVQFVLACYGDQCESMAKEGSRHDDRSPSSEERDASGVAI
jgi:hypothetical protein